MSNADSIPTLPLTIHTSDVAALINVWRDELQLGLVSEKDMEARVDGLRFIDAQDQAWSPGFNTGRWYYYDAGKWVPADPPLELEAVGGDELLVEENTQQSAQEQTQDIPEETVQSFCTQCGNALAEGKKFCTQCGHPVVI